MRRLITFVICCLLAGCQSLQGDDMPATMRVELDAYSTEAAEINSQAVAQRTQAAATIQAAGTLAADYYHYNNMLIATVRAVIPATPPERLAVEIESSGGGSTSNQVNQMGGVTELGEVGIASTINPENGCSEAQYSQFNVNEINTLYLTAVAANIQSGTRLEVDWEYNDQIMFQRSWIAQASQVDVCISLAMSSSDAVFQPGSWSASVFVNEEPFIEVPFVLVSG